MRRTLAWALALYCVKGQQCSMRRHSNARGGSRSIASASRKVITWAVSQACLHDRPRGVRVLGGSVLVENNGEVFRKDKVVRRFVVLLLVVLTSAICHEEAVGCHHVTFPAPRRNLMSSNRCLSALSSPVLHSFYKHTALQASSALSLLYTHKMNTTNSCTTKLGLTELGSSLRLADSLIVWHHSCPRSCEQVESRSVLTPDTIRLLVWAAAIESESPASTTVGG